MNAEIIAVGSELLTPHRQDTNSLYLTEKLNDLGVEVRFKCIVGDDRENLVAAAKLAMRRSDIIIFSGGLGPTEDDLTREAVAEALGLTLNRDPEILRKLEERFAKRGYKFSPNNARQADVIANAIALPNTMGTAPGQWISGKYDGQERILILLPGPPYELKALFEGECIARLRAKVPTQHIATRTLKMALIPESQVDARVCANLQGIRRRRKHNPRRQWRDPASLPLPEGFTGRSRSPRRRTRCERSKTKWVTPSSRAKAKPSNRLSATCCKCAA